MPVHAALPQSATQAYEIHVAEHALTNDSVLHEIPPPQRDTSALENPPGVADTKRKDTRVASDELHALMTPGACHSESPWAKVLMRDLREGSGARCVPGGITSSPDSVTLGIPIMAYDVRGGRVPGHSWQRGTLSHCCYVQLLISCGFGSLQRIIRTTRKHMLHVSMWCLNNCLTFSCGSCAYVGERTAAPRTVLLRRTAVALTVSMPATHCSR